MDLDQLRRESLDSWDRFARNWRDERDYLWEATHGVGEAMVDRLGAEPGDTVLELAAGTGDTGLLAAKRIGPEGKLIQTDFAPGMVEVAKQFAADAGVANVEHRVLDAERMDLEDDSVDGVLCRFGYMLMADPRAALAETRRVLRDGGTLSFAVWGPPDRNLWAFIPGFALVEAGHLPPPDPTAPGIFALGDTERIKELVNAAGFSEPEIDELTVEWEYDDSSVHWEKTMKLAAPIADAMNAVSKEERDRIREVVASRVAEQLERDPASLNGHTWVVSTS